MDALKKKQNYIGDNSNSKLVLLTDQPYPLIRITFGGLDAHREPMEIDIEEFIAVKGFRAKGKRITTCHIESIEQLEPRRMPEPEASAENAADDDEEPPTDDTLPDIMEEETPTARRKDTSAQLSLFTDEEA